MIDDRTTAARIRDEAMGLFAAHGADAVSLRTIAAAAGVSAPLIVHHYGSKAGLRAAVDAHLGTALAEVIGSLEDPGALTDAGGMAALLDAALAAYPNLLPYLRRVLIEGGDLARSLFADLHTATVSVLERLRTQGLVRPGDDETTRAAFLLANDLAVIVFADLIAAATGSDPTRGDGLGRWTAAVVDVYTNGLYATPEPVATP
jgi:AcrR family transcriptional regulator